ncbi:MAG: neutral zinc metallopeptidase [Acidimicrobiia bacterium]
MTRRLVLIGLALSLVAVACGDDDARPIFSSTTEGPRTTTAGAGGDFEAYPDTIIEDYLSGCTEEDDDGFCRCTLDEFQQRLTVGEFLELMSTDVESSAMVEDVVELCLIRDFSDTTTTTGGAVATTTTESEFTSITDIETITQLTIADLEEWWESELPAVFGVAYEQVSGFGPYFISQGDIPFCGGPLKREEFETNAFYCSIDDTVQWDAETLMAPLFQEFGDFTVALVLAHEWGHAVQARFGFDEINQPTIVSELQADCLAGAWTRRIDAEESNLLRLEAGDLEEAMAGFLLIGDQIGSAPGGPNAHGGSFDRLNAFFDGFNGGSAECATYEDSPPDIVFIPLRVGEDPTDGGDLPLADTAPFLIDALEVFWTIVYPEVFGTAWIPVSGTVPYRPSSGVFPSCAGNTLDRAFYEGNAFYCAADDYVAWDDEVLFPDLYVQIGDFAIGLILANEWGRAVQSRAGLDIHTPAAQLQVDCLTGVWTAALIPDDNPTGILLSAGDLEEGIAGFLTLSATPGDEGTVSAFDRFEAFKDGFFLGTDACGF